MRMVYILMNNRARHAVPLRLVIVLFTFIFFAHLQSKSDTAFLQKIFDADQSVSIEEIRLAEQIIDTLNNEPDFRQDLSDCLYLVLQNKNDPVNKLMDRIYKKSQSAKSSPFDSNSGPNQTVLILQLLLINKYYSYQILVKPDLNGIVDQKTIIAVKQLKDSFGRLDRFILDEMQKVEKKSINKKHVRVKAYGQTRADYSAIYRKRARAAVNDSTFISIPDYSPISAEYVQNEVFKGLPIPSDPQITARIIGDFIKSKMKYNLLTEFTINCLSGKNDYNKSTFEMFSTLLKYCVGGNAKSYSYDEVFQNLNIEEHLKIPLRDQLIKKLILPSDNNQRYFLPNGKFNPEIKLESRKQPPVKRYNDVIDSLNLIKIDSSHYYPAFVKLMLIQDPEYRVIFFNFLKKLVYAKPYQYFTPYRLQVLNLKDTTGGKNSYDTGNPEEVIKNGVGVCRNFAVLLIIIYNKAAELNPNLAKTSRMTNLESTSHAWNMLYFINKKGKIEQMMIDLSLYITYSKCGFDYYKDPKERQECFDKDVCRILF